MSQNTLIVSNWKMNFNFIQASNFALNLKKLKFNHAKITNIICPQFLLLPILNKILNESHFTLGSQDFHHQLNGPFTGDTSVELIKNYNCEYSIIGHSERREFHNESNQIINKKIQLCFENDIKPILCVGESIKQRENKNYKDYILKQLSECIGVVNNNDLIVAYEPLWSIGTGVTPTVNDIDEISKLIFIFLKKKKINNFKILYGGSVNSLNFAEINSINNINGALIGGASLKIEEMEKILTSC